MASDQMPQRGQLVVFDLDVHIERVAGQRLRPLQRNGNRLEPLGGFDDIVGVLGARYQCGDNGHGKASIMARMAASMTSICLAGPTASGKSALAIALACEVGGAIINTDSMQVYADLHVLTARPDADETQSAPHHLYGHVDAAMRYSAGLFLDDAARPSRTCAKAGMTPIFTGGTGLYFKGLLEGFSPIPDVPDDVLAELAGSTGGRGGRRLACRA
jgi:hypothetical protein